MMLKRTVLLILPVLLVGACGALPKLDQVVTDRRTEYQKSQPLPDLEIPPDLTVEAQEDPLVIPNENVTSLSEFERRRSRRSGTAAAATNANINPLEDEQWLSLAGNTEQNWPQLREFWVTHGYTLELDDKDLGVMETGWLETSNQGISSFRDKFSIIAENPSENTTVIYINNQRQEKIDSGDGTAEWIDVGKDAGYERQTVSDMNLFFYGATVPAGASSLSAAGAVAQASAPQSNAAATASSTAVAAVPAGPPKAEVLNLDEDKVYLSLPDEFTKAWDMAKNAITDAGMQIEHNDRDKGLYYVTYFPDQEKTVLSALKFWGEDNGQLYQISLTGVGDKTELVVLDNNGDWAPKDEAARILTYIQTNYNNALR